MNLYFTDQLRSYIKREFKRLTDKQWPKEDAMRAARVKAAFKSFEDVYWKLEPIEDQEPYDDSDIDDPQEKKDVRQRIERDGVWGIQSSWRLTEHGTDQWEVADGTWGFIGDDWKDSGYDTDLRRAAMLAFLEAAKEFSKDASSPSTEGFQNAIEIARFGIRNDQDVQEADKQGILLLDGGVVFVEQAPVQPTAPKVTFRALPQLRTKYWFQIRQDVYTGWNVLLFEQRPDRPFRIEKMTSGLEPRREALNVAKNYARDLAERVPPSPNVIRVLDDQGTCVYAVKSTASGPLDTQCPTSDFDRPALQRIYSNPLSRRAQAAVAVGTVATAFGLLVWWLSRKSTVVLDKTFVFDDPTNTTYRGVQVGSVLMFPDVGGWSYRIDGPANYPLPLGQMRGQFNSGRNALAAGHAEIDQAYANGWQP